MAEPSSNLERLKALLAEAIEMPAPEREAFVASIGAQDERLAADLQRLLAAHDAADEGTGFLVDPTLDPASISTERRNIGPFKVLRLIGEGGFGEVYLAEQSSPIRRQVALKLIKPGMDSGQVMARFDAERQALAIMDHPNIARVYDAGTDDRGRPWFAMELVAGEPIHQFADKHRLNVRKRIELMIPVCRAVHHAHQKGVIHRDLKPGNVLVSEVDGHAVPKVIDFGVAKALGRPLTDKTLFTELRTLVGTPEYMSPEQADFDGGRDIDTRSDVYSLGVLLYELLVGATPFDARDLRSHAFGEIQRILREVDPPTPSTRFQTLDTRASAAANRNIDPGRLSSSLRGELDWITMKCLEKDRSRRYDSAAKLADELANFLDNKAVNAGPVSPAYRLRKFVSRHRAGVVLATIATLASIVAASGIVWGYFEARRERDAAIASREVAEKARAAETEARAVEEENSRFLREMFESIDPSQALGKEVTVREVLDAATSKIDSTRPTNARVESSLRATFGRAYAGLGVLAPARRELERAIELDDSSRSTVRAYVGVLADLGEHEKAKSVAQAEVNASIRDFGPASPETWAAENGLADVLVRQGKRTEAEQMLIGILNGARVVATTRPSAVQDVIVEAISSLSDLQINDGRFADAEKSLLEALQVARSENSRDGPVAIGILSNLGDLYRNIGRFDDAVTSLRSARTSALKVLGPDHTNTLTVTNNLALALMTVGMLDEAQSLFDEVIMRRTRLQGEDHPRTLLARSNRGLVLQQRNQFAEAEKEFADVAARYTRVLGPDHQDTIVAENNYASLLIRTGRLDEAEPIMRRLLDRVITTQGENNLAAASISLRLGSILMYKNDFAGAEPILAKAFTAAESMGLADVQGGFALGYGICLSELGKAEQAIAILSRADTAMARHPSPDPVGLQRLAKAMVKSQAQLGNAPEVARWQQKTAPSTSQPSTPASQPASRPT